MKTKIRFGAALVSSLCLLPSAFGQGALTPPGAPGPTMKSLDQIQPRTPVSSAPYYITQPGSYYLTTNLTFDAPVVFINTNDVSVDLNGFVISGSQIALAGVYVSGSYANVWIGNGTVRGCTYGVYVRNAVNARIENIRVFNNFTGINAGDQSLIIGCQAVSNFSGGISMGQGGTIKDSVAGGNGLVGITVGSGCAILHCDASFNGSNGITGGDGTTVSQCAAYQNSGSGIVAGTGCSIAGCTALSNAVYGVSVGNGSVVSGCNVESSGNNGIAATNSTVTGCTVISNGISGFNGVYAFSSSVSGCNAQANVYSGIFAEGTGGTISGNHCSGNNTPAGSLFNGGILVNGSNYRVENNQVAGNGNAGIFVSTYTSPPATNNVVVKNTVTGNGANNYINPGNNDFGAIGTAAAATSPWANISH